MKKNVQELFNLPHEEKKLLWQKPGEMEGFGQMFVVSEEHKLEWADLFYISTLPSYARHPHLFPNIPRQFRLLYFSLFVCKHTNVFGIFCWENLQIMV